MTRLQKRSGALAAGRGFLRSGAKMDVIGDRNHLVKPINGELLLQNVRAAMGEPAAPAAVQSA